VSPSAGTVAILFALEREAAPFRRAARDIKHFDIVVSGIGHRRARAAAEAIAATSPRLVIAAGFSGALQPGLGVADVVWPAEVVDAGCRVWPSTPLARQSNVRLLTATALVATRQEKLDLGRRFQAAIVDMESAAVAEVCSRKGIPFTAVRAISDAVDTELSPQLVRLFSGGTVSSWKACRALVSKPSLFWEFRRLARDTRIASRALAEELLTVIGNPPLAITPPPGSPASSTSRSPS
jgi:adenosylhomocysteine nucleosidase